MWKALLLCCWEDWFCWLLFQDLKIAWRDTCYSLPPSTFLTTLCMSDDCVWVDFMSLCFVFINYCMLCVGWPFVCIHYSRRCGNCERKGQSVGCWQEGEAEHKDGVCVDVVCMWEEGIWRGIKFTTSITLLIYVCAHGQSGIFFGVGETLFDKMICLPVPLPFTRGRWQNIFEIYFFLILWKQGSITFPC